jgi:hypothetical protein
MQHIGGEREIQKKLLLQDLKGRNHLGNIGTYERIIIQRISNG